ncbi:hypothetical protein ACIQUM_07630 [Amycolatopsis azurea]|uniref:hypothetical protein n=1 Tax=Amycolatopsis azurea TaxID=36819 RepID=UPI00382547B6
MGKPHTTATITDAEVQFSDPAKPTLEEMYVSERRYTSKKNPDSGVNYTIDSKGTSLPIIAIPAAGGSGTFDQDTSGQELAQGLDVELVLRVYKPENHNNRGLALSQVIVHETPRYYTAGGVALSELAARGIVFNTPPRAVQAPASPSTASAGGAMRVETKDGLPAPSPQSTHSHQPQPASVPDEESLEQRLARLEQENATLKNTGSAVGAPIAVGASPGTPDSGDQQAGITYQG